MAVSRKKLTAKQEAAVIALLTARSVEEAARTTDVPARTLHRWLQEPLFQAACRKARRADSAQADTRLLQAKGPAVSTLLRIMVDAKAPAATRLRAADSVLNHVRQALEIEDVEARLAALEQAAELSKQER